jgi:hypothetical protein
MNEELFKKLIPKIIMWMLEEKNLNEFCEFDPKNYFMLLKNFFSIEQLFSIIKNFANESEENKIAGMLSSNKIAKLKDSQPISYIDYIIKMVKKLNKRNALLYLYDFLLKITPNLELSKEIILQSATYIFQNYNFIIINKNKNETKQICDNLKEIFDSREDFTENELIELIQNSKDHLFDEIVIYVYQKFHKYTDCLNSFLDDKLNIDNEEKAKTVFNWLNNILSECIQKKNNKLFSQLKNIVLNKCDSLLSLSIEKFKHLVDNYFPNSKKEIISNIKNANLKYEFLNLILKDIKQEIKKSELNEEDQIFIEFVLYTHIELLVELKKFDLILQSLKEINLYPYFQIVDILEKNHISDALIFVLLKLGDPDNKAIEICMNDFDIIFNEIKKKFNQEFYEDDHNFNMNLTNFEKTIQNCYTVCINTYVDEIQTGNINDENFKSLIELCYNTWKQFLIKLYSINGEITNFKNKDNKYYIKFKEYFSNKISDLLFTMSNYVSIKEIIKIVSDNYKDAEFKEFKSILLKILNSNGSQITIFTNAKNLLKNCVLLNEENFIKLNIHGNEIKIDECSLCHKKFDKSNKSKEIIVVFKCGHMLHSKCIVKDYSEDGEFVNCNVCRENEIESSIDNTGYKSIKINNTFNNSDDENNDDENETRINFEQMRLYSNMRNMDRRHLEKRTLNM